MKRTLIASPQGEVACALTPVEEPTPSPHLMTAGSIGGAASEGEEGRSCNFASLTTQATAVLSYAVTRSPSINVWTWPAAVSQQEGCRHRLRLQPSSPLPAIRTALTR
jgi:hypothetical protein